MPPDRPAPGSPADWLLRAKGDLALAMVPLPDGAFYEDLAFHAQQAAEKALKAVYLHQRWAFRYVHDIEELVTGLERNGLEIPTDVRASVVLTMYASQTRYPGPEEELTEEELRQATVMADAVVSWAEMLLRT